MIGHVDYQCRTFADVDMHLCRGPEVDDLGHGATDDVVAGRYRLIGKLHGDAFGPDHDGGRTGCATVVDGCPESRRHRRAHGGPAGCFQHIGVEDVRCSQKARDIRRRRCGVDLLRRAHLLDSALSQYRDLVAHGERFFLVMGDVDEGDAHLALHSPQFQLQLFA